VVKISKTLQPLENLQVAGHTVGTTPAAKCLGVWWRSNLSASKSANKNIKKARRAFLTLGCLGAFQGDLNPLSTRSIFETCVLPVLLSGCKAWLIDSSSLAALESFQCEIGCRILCLPKHYSGNEICIGLHFPSMSICASSGKLLSSANSKLLSESLSHRPSTKLVSTVAMSSSWRQLWDMALNRGTKGTRSMGFLFKELSRPCTGDRLCKVYDNRVSAETYRFKHCVVNIIPLLLASSLAMLSPH